MKKFLVITVLISLVISFCSRSFGQTQQTYNETCAYINLFESIKVYTPETVTPLLSTCLEGLVEDNCVYSFPGLKYRLVGRINKSKLSKQANATDNWIEGDLLYLLYHSRQNGPRADLGTKNLAAAAKDNGAKLVKWVRSQWNKKELNGIIFDTLQDYDPVTAVTLIDVIAQPYWSNPAKIPEQTQSTLASRQLWQAYYDARKVEIAKRCVAYKLLAEYGGIDIPRKTYLGNVTVMLDPVDTWTSSDIDGLYRIIQDPFAHPAFCDMARLKLGQLHAQGY